MGRRGGKRTEIDDLVELAVDRLTDRRNDAQRRAERLARREAAEARNRRTIAGVGAGLVAGGLAMGADLMMPAPVGIGFLAAMATIYALRALAAAPRVLARRPRSASAHTASPAPSVPLNAEGLPPGRAEVIGKVLAGAKGHLAEIVRAAGAARGVEASALLTRLGAIGARVCDRVAAQPQTFEAAQRLLTHHVERAAHLAGLAAPPPGADAPDPNRAEAIVRVLARMEQLFDQVDQDLRRADARDLDLELRLIDQALDEDLRRS